MVDRGGMWYRVLWARYGEEGVAEGGWQGCVGVVEGYSEESYGVGLIVGSWFEDNLQKEVGNRGDTFPSTDP